MKRRDDSGDVMVCCDGVMVCWCAVCAEWESLRVHLASTSSQLRVHLEYTSSLLRVHLEYTSPPSTPLRMESKWS